MVIKEREEKAWSNSFDVLTYKDEEGMEEGEILLV